MAFEKLLLPSILQTSLVSHASFLVCGVRGLLVGGCVVVVVIIIISNEPVSFAPGTSQTTTVEISQLTRQSLCSSFFFLLPSFVSINILLLIIIIIIILLLLCNRNVSTKQP